MGRMSKSKSPKEATRYDNAYTGLWPTWDDFWHKTGINGISNAGIAKSDLRRACWMVIFVVHACLTVQGVWYVAYDYLEYPVTTSVSVEHAYKIDFPAVTVCNQNRINCESLKTVKDYCEERLNSSTNASTTTDEISAWSTICLKNYMNSTLIVDYLYDKGQCNLTYPGPKPKGKSGERRSENGSNDKRDVQIRRRRSSESRGTQDGNKDFKGSDKYGTQPTIVSEEMELLQTFMTLDEPERILIGHNFSSFIKSCTFRGRNCLEEQYFYTRNVALYGNCFIFNAEYNADKDSLAGSRTSSLTGPSFGLNLIITLDQLNYMRGGITKQAGARLVVHSCDQWPLVDENGMDISPATYTLVPITEVDVERKKDPYTSKCIDSWTVTGYATLVQDPTGLPSVDESVPKMNYNLGQCQRICIFSNIVNDCNCFHPLYLDFDSLRNTLAPCNLTTGSDDEICTTSLISEIDEGIVYCNCAVECNETEYEAKMSSSLWPSNYYEDTAKATYASGPSGGPDFKDNFAQIGIYFQSLNTKKIIEEAKYDFTSMVSAIGGALSLYLGISVAMMFEVLELLIDVFINLFTFCLEKARNLRMRL